ncbi:MAG: hypothetical protein IT280_11670 [Ignavibacteria bacterium]|nr:hypothetical protein [Ignavibacteria bacterium]
MFNSILISTLKTFTTKEMREFGELVCSPYFNKNQSAIRLYGYLKKCYPEFDSKKMEKEKIYKTIFGKAEYSEGFMKTITHILTELSEEYLKLINLKKMPAYESLLTARELNERKLEKLLIKNLSDAKREIEVMKAVGEKKYYYYNYLLEKIKTDYIEWSRFKNKNFKEFDNVSLSDTNNSLAHYFFEDALITYRSILARRQQTPVAFDERITENVISFLLNTDNDFIQNTNLRLHLYEVLLLKEKTDKYFYLLKDILFKESKEIGQNKKFTLNTILQQFCLDRMMAGEKQFLRERHELYKLALEKGFYRLKSHVYFDTLLFGNISLVAIRLKEFDWAESFIEKYENDLPEDSGEVVVAYGKGRLYMERGELEKALETVSKVKTFMNIPLKAALRNLMLMIYYELSYYDQAEYLLSSHRKFIASVKEDYTDERYERQTNFMKYYARLLKVKENSSKEDLDDLVVALHKHPNVLENEWLLEKANELTK